MLCLNCIHASSKLPEKVEIEVKINEEVKKIDVTDRMIELWKSVEKRGYTTIIFCKKLGEIKAGSPPHPTKIVDECAEFSAA